MIKFKHKIVKNKLPWERENLINPCNNNSCLEFGEYKAPKSRLKLNEYYFFCLKHITEYNKSWDFYKGLNVDQIELSIIKDTVWNRPSWPLKGNPNNILNQLKEFLSQEEDFIRALKAFQKYKMV